MEVSIRTPGRLPAFPALLVAAAVAFTARGDCTLTVTGLVPLPDLAAGYGGFPGGLYAGANQPPPDHRAAALERAQAIEPLDAAGLPDAAGVIGLLSLGMSNTTQEFSVFAAMAAVDPSVDTRLAIVDGAQGGQAIDDWLDEEGEAWRRLDQRLAARGVTPQQVQVVWMKHGRRHEWEDGGFPVTAMVFRDQLATLARRLADEFPRLQLLFVSSRTRAWRDDRGGAQPEPFAYESGFAVQWLIDDQIAGDPTLNPHPSRGEVEAPLLLWGPYLWADGTVPRSDGLVWLCSDVRDDYVHPSPSGQLKVAEQLLAFFATRPEATPWFLRASSPEQASDLLIDASRRAGPAPLVVHFSATATDSWPGDAAWTFDDGTSARGAVVTKRFDLPGDYSVWAVLADGEGDATLATLSVAVGEGAGEACRSDHETLCLVGSRFAVAATRQVTPSAPTVPARALPLTGDTGAFWFFDEGNLELVVKVLDGCAVNGRHWVFAAGLTDVAVDLVVRDTATGTSWRHRTGFATPFHPVQDTAAFPCH